MYDDDYDYDCYFVDYTVRKADTGWHKPMGSLYDRCMQSVTWTDASRITWLLEEMTPIHRRNLLVWLERRAEALHQWAFENNHISYTDRGLSEFEWLFKLPLVARLTELAYCQTCGHSL